MATLTLADTPSQHSPHITAPYHQQVASKSRISSPDHLARFPSPSHSSAPSISSLHLLCPTAARPGFRRPLECSDLTSLRMISSNLARQARLAHCKSRTSRSLADNCHSVGRRWQVSRMYAERRGRRQRLQRRGHCSDSSILDLMRSAGPWQRRFGCRGM
jgi:hypothetical protein